MKRLILVAGMICHGALVHVFAQGTVNFNVGKITNEVGVLCSGTAYRAQLFAGPAGTPESSLLPVGAIVPFRTGSFAGYVDLGTAGARAIPGVAPGVQATVQVRAWAASSGADWGTASTAPRGIFGVSPMVTFATGGVPDPVTGIPSLPSHPMIPGFQLMTHGQIFSCIATHTAQGLQFSWLDLGTNYVYRVETSDSLDPAGWLPAAGAAWPISATAWSPTALPAWGSHFYRVRAELKAP